MWAGNLTPQIILKLHSKMETPRWTYKQTSDIHLVYKLGGSCLLNTCTTICHIIICSQYKEENITKEKEIVPQLLRINSGSTWSLACMLPMRWHRTTKSLITSFICYHFILEACFSQNHISCSIASLSSPAPPKRHSTFHYVRLVKDTLKAKSLHMTFIQANVKAGFLIGNSWRQVWLNVLPEGFVMEVFSLSFAFKQVSVLKPIRRIFWSSVPKQGQRF